MADGGKKTVLVKADALKNASVFAATHTTAEGVMTLVRWNSIFWKWTGQHFGVVPTEALRNDIWHFLGKAVCADGEGGFQRFKPKKTDVDNVFDALKAVCAIDASSMPCWLVEDDDLQPAVEYLSTANGLLHVPSAMLIPHTPTFFSSVSSPVAFDPKARAPRRFLRFLDEVFEDDQETKQAVKEMFGYCLVGDTKFQKMWLLYGPKRSGKSTLIRLLTYLVGKANVTSPSFSSLGEPRFGLIPLIGKSLCFINDLRIGPNTGALNAEAAARMLQISGEDSVSIEFKVKNERWEGKLPTRFVITSNMLPSLPDGSTALANRFIITQARKSFFDQEDPGLYHKLEREISGILNWCVAGYASLYKRGRFVQPTSSVEAVAELEELGSPMLSFIRESCEIRAGETYLDALYSAYKSWHHQASSGTPPLSKPFFGRSLKAAVPALTRRTTSAPERAVVYSGITLKAAKTVGPGQSAEAAFQVVSGGRGRG